MTKPRATVLVIDAGGRGAALVDRYLESPQVFRVLSIPGNDLMGYGSHKIVKTFRQIKTTDVKNIKKICRQYKVDLVDIAQDDAVAAGVADELITSGFRVFGPTKAAGQIEWNKAWARRFMKKFKIPTPFFKICQSENEGVNFLKNQKDKKWFIKAAGLAAGKGALFAENNQGALEKIGQMKKFGSAGKTYLIEECLIGEEFSSFAALDGDKFILLGHAQDHKTVYNAGLGPNTGGMGCSSPPAVITSKVEAQVREIFKKATRGLVQIKRPYRGILYLGAMVSRGKVYVIEFNARWGDPEAQVIIPAIKNDFYELTVAILEGRIDKIKIKKDNLYRIAVTAAARGYPNDYSAAVNKYIRGLDNFIKNPRIKIFGAGLKVKGRKFQVTGGRIFYVMASGENIVKAREKAYNALSQVYVEGNNLHYRTDIGYRDLERFYVKSK